jgi:hypothetical protein
VIFDENTFPFSKLHPNSSPHLRDEISLLPSSLVPMAGGESAFNHMSNASNPIENCENIQHQKVAANNEATPYPGTAPRVDSSQTNSVPGVCTSPGGDLL